MTTASRTALLDRVATAPISWGVCEVPGWGYQLLVHSVLGEMRSAGFTHTELGSWGYLPTEPTDLCATLDDHGLTLLGGFVPLVLHDPSRAGSARAAARRWASLISGGGGRFFVTCAVSREDHWRHGPLSDAEWAVLCSSLAEVDGIAAEYGLQQVYHPHFGSLVETDAELRRVLEGSQVSLVLDTAHITIGGTDVVELLDDVLAGAGSAEVDDVLAGAGAAEVDAA